ncbi:MAG TPA: hypothetical protein ENK82_06870 [Campylobacterales bacterium]|nr:hypothetical protein [Campylobacterales bacterium]HHS93053.1 hypothetical protein [Campylobacterales bacterium]
MYVWKIEKLKADILLGLISPREKKFYLIAFLLLYSSLFIQAIIQVEILWGLELAMVQFLISILGLYYVYRRSRSSFKVFVERFTPVAWVFIVRSMFFMMLGMLNLYVMTWLFGFGDLFTAKNSLIIGMCFELLLYWRIGKHIESLNVIESVN